jgi:drug/metabolite transporter (DMT)-like permease
LDILLGLLFAILWSSAPIASKIGLHNAAPLTILDIRFVVTAVILMTYVYGIKRTSQRPRGREWLRVTILALCNSTIYLGLAWLSLREISAGVFNLFVASNPFLVAIIASIWLKREVSRREWLGMVISAVGLILATLPLLSSSQATLRGILLVTGSVVTYAIGSVYFKAVRVELTGLVLNAWQITLGAVLLLPFALAMNGDQTVKVTPSLVGALLWVVFGVSIVAVLIWFYLLKRDPVRASMWMFLTPVFGYILAAIVLGEPIHTFDIVGTILVMAGLLVSGVVDVRRIPILNTLLDTRRVPDRQI